MTVEITLAVVISIISLVVSIVRGVKTDHRTDTKEIQERVAETTRLDVKLDAISKDIADLKDEIRLQRKEFQNLTERVAKVEASASQAHKRQIGRASCRERVYCRV